MASITEIPEHLFQRANRPEFVEWITTIPVDAWVKRQLIRQYTFKTDMHFTLPQIAIMMAHRPEQNVTPQ